MTNEDLIAHLTAMESRINALIDVVEQRVMQLVESHSQELQMLGH